MKIILIFIISFNCHATMYLKVSGETIMGHDYNMHDEYTIAISDTILVNEEGNYIYKFKNNALVPLSDLEINNHPYKKAKDTAKTAREEAESRLPDLEQAVKDHNCAIEAGYAKKKCELDKEKEKLK